MATKKKATPIPIENSAPTVEEVVERGLAAVDTELRRMQRWQGSRRRPLDPETGKQLCAYLISACRVGKERRDAAGDDALKGVTDAKLDAMLKKQLSETYGVPLADLVEFLETRRSSRVS